MKIYAKDVPKMGDDDADKIILHKAKIENLCAFAGCDDALKEKFVIELPRS